MCAWRELGGVSVHELCVCAQVCTGVWGLIGLAVSLVSI